MKDHTIMVVEDDPDISQSLEDVLRLQGYGVVTAANGKEALERLRQIEKPSLILLDLMMPVMSGGEFLGVLRQSDEFATVPVVIVSAWAKEAAQVRVHAQGFMKKPVSPELLLETTQRFCVTDGEAEE